MYTQCPECRASFRVTAAVLQQAAGRVRCGACGYAFNALERLSEAPPDDGDGRALPDDFDTLSATDNVRIEDTGVEWQVLEGEESADSDPQEALDLVNAPGAEEQRYDDNTPLPDVFEDDGDEPAPDPPRRRAEDFIEPRSPEFDERQVDLALSEPEDWTDLLDEVGDQSEPAATGGDAGDDDAQVDDDTQSGLELLDPDVEPTGEHPALAPEPLESAATAAVQKEEAGSETEEAPASVAADSGHYVPPPTEEEITINRLIDQELLRLSQQQPDLAATGSHRQETTESPPHVETIIMEGAFVRSSLEADEPSAGEQAPPADDDATEEVLDLRDTYVRTRDRGREGGRQAAGRGRYAAAAGVAALALLLAAQVVHAYRETLATYGSFGDSLVSFYAAAGAPITPEWDANGWQFQATRGNTDAADSALTISSTLANASGQALPYPLLHVALTDRYEEIIASELLEARQYLEIRAANGRVAPGGKLNASITIAPLAPQAAGFKLNVCYPLNASEVRCATGAFKER